MALGFGKDGEMRIVLRVKDDGTAEIEKFGDASERTAKKSEIDWKKIGAAAAAAAAVIGVATAALVKQQIDVAVATQDTADKLGLTTEALSGLQFVADRAGVATQTLDMALQRMTRRLAEAAQGTGEAKDALKDLNLNAAELAKLSPDQQYLAIAEALSKIPTQGERVRLAFKLFDSEGVAVVNTMQRGRRGIEETMAEAQRFGKVISTEFGLQAKQFDKNVKDMRAQLSGFAITIANEVLPVLNEFMERLSGTESLNTLSKMRAELGRTRSELAQMAESQKSIQGLVEPGLLARIRNLDAEIERVNTRIIDANSRLLAERRRIESAAADPGVAGPSRAEQEKTDALRQELAEQVEAVRVSTLTEMQLAQEKHDHAMELLRLAREQKIEAKIEFDTLEQELTAQHEQRLTEIAAAEAQKRAEELAQQIEDIRVSLATEEQLAIEKRASDLQRIAQAREEDIQSKIDFNVLEQEVEAAHQAEIERIATESADKRRQEAERFEQTRFGTAQVYRQLDLSAAGFFFGTMSNLMQSGSKKQFKIGQKAAIAGALVNTYKMAVDAYQALAGIPIVGPALGAAAAAAATLFGRAQVRSIKAQQFEGGGAAGTGTVPSSPNTGLPVGSPGGGGAGSGGPPNFPIPPPGPPAVIQPSLTVIVQGDVRGDRAFMDDVLIPGLQDFLRRDGVLFNAQTGQAVEIIPT